MMYAQRLAALTCAVLAAGARPAWTQEPVTAFMNVSVVPMDREHVLTEQTVVVQGDRIIAMGPAKEVSIPATAVRIDSRGKFLMPGLADMHMHVGFKLTDVKDAEQALFLLVANGVTTIRNLDYLPQSRGHLGGKAILRLRARVAAGELWGPRIYTSDQWYADTSKSVLQNVEAYKAAGYDLIKLHDKIQTPLAKLDSLIEAARKLGVPIAGHAVGGLMHALEHHFASIEHLSGYFGREGVLRDSLADTLSIPAVVAATRQAGVYITPTQAVYENLGTAVDFELKRYVPAAWYGFYAGMNKSAVVDTAAMRQSAERAEAAHRMRRRITVALQAAGVPLLLGTDSPLLVPGYGVHQELQALVHAGLTPYQALVTSTWNVAAYFETLDSTGTVAVGKRADLVLLTANPLTDIRHTRRIAGVMVAGRWLSAAEIEHQLAQYSRPKD